MSAELVGVIGLAIMLLLFFARMWIGAAMAMIGMVGYAYIMGIPASFAMISQIPFSTIASYSLSVIPLFILMGNIIFVSDIGDDLYDTAYKWMGQFRGGLAMATVVACTFFAAITGVSTPALVTMGKVAIPSMRQHKYSDTLSTGSLVCAGTMAFLIPPSIAFVIYAILTEQSVSILLMAGFLPGLLLACIFIMIIFIIVRINPAAGPPGEKTTWKEKLFSMKGGIWATLVLFLLVLGGIYMGVFTPTEAGAIGSFGAIVIAIVMRRLSLNKFLSAALDSAETSAFIMFLIMGAYLLMKFLAVSKLPFMLVNTLTAFDISQYAILAMIVALYLILGMFLDIVSAIILTIPVLFPLITGLGFDPVWFGVIVVILIEMGVVTPPVGMDVFVLSGATGIPLSTIFKGAIPFVGGMIFCIIILTIFPQIALLLPNMMYGR